MNGRRRPDNWIPYPERAWPRGTLLGMMSPADRTALLALGTLRHYEPARALIREGDADGDVFLLLDGYAKVTGSGPDGHVVLLSIRVGGDIVGELAALDGQARSASVTAATAVTARSISRQAFLAFLEHHPAAARCTHRTVAGKLRTATRHRIDVGSAAIIIRVARVIEHLAEAHGRPAADGVHVDVPLSQTELAALVGAAEPSVHRALARLRREKIISTGYRHLLIRDRASLQTLSTADT